MPLAEWVVIDWESKSACELKTAGTERYWQDKTTSHMCLAIAWPDSIDLWTPYGDLPHRLFAHVKAGGLLISANSAFEWCGWQNMRRRDPRWPELPLEQMDCVLARARAIGLPGSVEKLCAAVRLGDNKDAEGSKALKKLMRPRRKDPLEFWTPETAPEDFEKLYAYARQDAKVERELHLLLPALTPSERETWLLDQKINQRGALLDVASVRRALQVIEEAKEDLRARGHEIAGMSPTQRDKLLEWIRAEGVELETLTKGDVAKALANPDLKESVRAILGLRQQISKGSTAKFKRMLAQACDDGTAKGQYVYHGAGPGRWAGKGIQLQNLPRQTKSFKAKDADLVINYLKYPSAAKCIKHEYDSLMEPLSLSLRGFIVPRPGNRFVASDYSNIEGRVLAWLADEEWKLEAFRAFDAGCGPDLYKLAYARSFGVGVETVDDDGLERQTGKCQELGLGFAGGVGALLKMCATYFVDPAKIAAAVKAITAPELWAEVYKRCPKPGTRFRCGLEAEVWTGLRIVVDNWRASHPATLAYWGVVEDAAAEAVMYPGVVASAGKIKYRVEGDFLQCRLPSSRVISYAYPEFKRFPSMDWEAGRDELKYRIENYAGPDNDPDFLELSQLKERLEIHCREENIKWQAQLTAWSESLDAKGKKVWRCRQLTKSILVENTVQGTAACCLREGKKNVEAAGYPIVMHAHDEIVSDVPIGYGDLNDFTSKMCAIGEWANGLPVVAAGYEAFRYRK
jgi:DNA polymerase